MEAAHETIGAELQHLKNDRRLTMAYLASYLVLQFYANVLGCSEGRGTTFGS